jgi:TetR/AcrR family transcriptional repressor of mexJK operon
MFIVVGSGFPTAATISAPLIMIEAIAPSIESLPKKARQVLAAAKTVFLRDGYDLASMDAIAREARVSKGTLYGHFTGKEQLFTAVVLVECRRHAELLDRIAAEGRSIDETLLEIGLNHATFLLRADVLAVFRVAISGTPRFPEVARQVYDVGLVRGRKILAGFITEAVRHGVLRTPDSTQAAELFLSMTTGFAHMRGLLGIEADFDDAEIRNYVRAGVEIFLSNFAPMPPKVFDHGAAAKPEDFI